MFLLDTCTFLWLSLDPDKVPEAVLKELRSPSAARFLSAASAWEIALKWRSGKLRLPAPPEEFIRKTRAEGLIESLDVTEAAALYLPKLPNHHADPFDRILICQAIDAGLTLVTPDAAIHRYPVRVLWG